LNVGKIPVRFTADSTHARNNRALAMGLTAGVGALFGTAV
jgi:hypothetical protein